MRRRINDPEPVPTQPATSLDGARQLKRMVAEAAGCTRCELYKYATQTVFGRGEAGASVMLVGEQPGDVEDQEGEPFVGPAGRILRDALEAAGLADAPRYVTNAVKHFKWEPRGKRRIHKRPSVAEMRACHYWLEEEIGAVRPKIIVALGATATRAVAGPAVQVMKDRGRRLSSATGQPLLVTVHPSSILRAPDSDARQHAMEMFVADLTQVAAWLQELTPPSPRPSRPPAKAARARTSRGG
jgi:uracil-DNA glycosylase family protein